MQQILHNIKFLNTIGPDTWRNILETDYQGASSMLVLKNDYIKFVSSISSVIKSTIFQSNTWEMMKICRKVCLINSK